MLSLGARVFLVGFLCLAVLVGWDEARARDIIDAPFDAASIDILAHAERVQSSANETDVEAAPDASGNQSALRLSARSSGPIYRWLVFSIRNSSPIPLEYVVVSQHKTFVGSGVLWPEFGSRILIDAQASPGLPPASEALSTADGFTFRLDSNQTVTYALEVAGPWPENLRIWQRATFEDQRQQVSFFHGLLLGIAVLVAIYISSLFIIRRKLVFPSAALFAWSGVTFLAIEFGYLPALIEVPIALEYKIRAIVECVMAFSLFACLYTFVELRKRMPAAGYFVLLLLLGTAALITYAWNQPEIAAGAARMSILFGAFLGLVTVLTLARRGVIRAQVALSAWVLIALWALVGALAATGAVAHEMVGPGLAAGIVLVNLMIAFTVTQYAFDAGVISSRFFEDSGRRALALAASEQCVWDWREDQGWLFVGQELERILGVAPGSLSGAGLKSWLELMHPGDRPAYVAAVEAAIQRGRGTFAQEFRMRRKDGTYRWYQLRARAIPGEQGRASRCIGTLADITTFKRSEERLLYDAVQDRLTGLPNRALFMDRLDRAMRRSQDDPKMKLFVGVVDIDRFKNVNDGLGHSIGDSILLTMARRLQKFMGPEDTLARLAGDQFGVIINAGHPEREMRDVAEGMREAVARPVQLNPREVFLTASVGVAEYTGDIHNPVDVLKDAEIALYEAKRRGKNKIEHFKPNMRDDRSKLIEIESDLRRALERNEIEVAYQPIHDLGTGQLAGFEALVRWRHRRHGILGPEEFIGVAEETGIIVDLGRYVMGEAARQLGIWQRILRPATAIFVSVNLSGRQVLDQNLVDDVKTIMSREDVAPGSLKLELTESMVMENAELSAQVLQKLRDAGVAILCDDFGTGYSSLAVLQRLPFDTIKLDRSFVMTDAEDDAAAVVLESIILLAHDLGMKIVAEGIETREQLERLREFECDFGQGYFFGEPFSARAVMETLGGKTGFAEPKRSSGGRGLFGRLLRPSTREEAPPPLPAPTRFKHDREDEEELEPDAEMEEVPPERPAINFREEIEARRLERLQRPTIDAVLPGQEDTDEDEQDDMAPAEDEASDDAEKEEVPLLLSMPIPARRLDEDEDDEDVDAGAEADAADAAEEEPEITEAGETVAEAAPDRDDTGEKTGSEDDADLFEGGEEEEPVDLDEAAEEAAAKPSDDDGEDGDPPLPRGADEPDPLAEDGEVSEHEKLIEDIASGNRKGSRLSKLLGRGKNKQAALEN